MAEKIKLQDGREIYEDDILLTVGETILLGIGAISAITLPFIISANNHKKPSPLEAKIENIQVPAKNIIGEEAQEKFYWVNNQRVYLEIDGKPVEEYFRK